MATETILKDKKYRHCLDATNQTYEAVSFWGLAETSHCADGDTVEDKIGNLQGITTSLNVTTPNYVLDATAGKTLNDRITQTNSSMVVYSTNYDGTTTKAVGDYVVYTDTTDSNMYLYQFTTAGATIDNATKITGNVGVISNSDGKCFVVGADTILKKCSSTIMNLGRGNSIDMKVKLPLYYQYLTVDNFITSFTGAWSFYIPYGIASASNTKVKSGEPMPKGSYNATTGIYTIKDINCSYGGDNSDGYVTINHGATYLIY